jgi:hypothetical protein
LIILLPIFFKRIEGTRQEYNKKITLEKNEKFMSQIKKFNVAEKTIMELHINEYNQIQESFNIAELSFVKREFMNFIMKTITDYNGTLSRVIAGKIISYFNSTTECTAATLRLIERIKKYNALNPYGLKINVFLYIETKTFTSHNGEILFVDSSNSSVIQSTRLTNRIFLKKEAADNISERFKTEFFPRNGYSLLSTWLTF